VLLGLLSATQAASVDYKTFNYGSNNNYVL